jgi:tellurite resistance protein TehA-like permease
MLLAGIGMVIGPIQAFILAVPNTLALLLPAATNPNPSLFPENPIITVVKLLFVFGAYWFVFSLVVQRDI